MNTDTDAKDNLLPEKVDIVHYDEVMSHLNKSSRDCINPLNAKKWSNTLK